MANPDVARAIADKMWAMFDRIEDLQCRFRSTMRPAGSGPENLKRWDDGFYAYKRGGYEMLEYQETLGTEGPVRYRYVLTPEKLAGLRENDRYGIRTGSVRPPTSLNFRLQWAPGHYLPAGFVQGDLLPFLLGGLYAVRLPKAKAGIPEFLAPVTPAKPDGGSKSRSQFLYVLALSSEQGMCPVKIDWYRGQTKEVETRLDLVEAAPGIWLAEHGTCRQWVGGRDEFAKGVESEFWLEPGSMRINSRLAVGFFQREFPPGTRVMDHITKTDFTQGMSGGTTTPDLKSVADRAQQMAPAGTAQPVPYAKASGGVWTGMDWFVAGLTVVLVLIGGAGLVALLVPSRRGRRPFIGSPPLERKVN